jgi:hypothetical protein
MTNSTVMQSHEHRLVGWMIERGEFPNEERTWHAVHRRSSSYGTPTESTTVHSHTSCPEIEGNGTQEMRIEGEGLAGVHLCRSCVLGPISPQAGIEELKQLTLDAHGLHRIWLWTEVAQDTDHVLVGRWNSALHAGVVQDVVTELRSSLDRIDAPGLASLQAKTEAYLEETALRFPASRQTSIEGAIREAAAAAMFFSDISGSRDILNGRYNDTQEVFYQWLLRTRVGGNPERAAAEIIEDPRAVALAEAGIDIAGLLDTWVHAHRENVARRDTVFFFASGLPSGIYGVPRSARDHIIAAGLRHRDKVWGYGELPRIVVEWLAKPAGDKETKVMNLDVEHAEGIDADIFAMALQLMRETQSNLGDRDNELRTPQGALAAAIQL